MFRFSYDTRGQSNEYSKMCLFVIYVSIGAYEAKNGVFCP